MTRYYELIDRRSGNLVGSYERRAQVARVVRESYEQYGIDGIADLVLSEIDDTGNDEATAFGAAILAYLLGTEMSVTSGAGEPAR